MAATAQPDQSEPTPPVQPQQPSLSQSFQLFVSRYEGNALASGVGALAVTSWCVAHGQDALTAAGITGSAVVLALVSHSHFANMCRSRKQPGACAAAHACDSLAVSPPPWGRPGDGLPWMNTADHAFHTALCWYQFAHC